MRIAVLADKKDRWLYGTVFLIILLSFTFNIFGTGYSRQWFNGFQEDSSAIVEKTALCPSSVKDYSGPIHASGDIDYEEFIKTKNCNPANYEPYASQFGLQARLFSLISSPGQVDHLSKVVKFILVVLMTIVMTIFILRTGLLFGRIPAFTTAVLVAFSPWLVAYAGNLYWVTFLMFLPFVFMYVTYPWFVKQRKVYIVYVVLGLLFLLKFLNGYEHASTLLISGFVPIVLYEMQGKGVKLTGILRQAGLVFFVGLCALVLAISANIVALREYAGSWNNAANLVFTRARERAGVEKFQSYAINGFEATAPEIYRTIDAWYDLDKLKDGKGNPAIYAALVAINYATLPAISLPIILKQPLGTFIDSIAVIGILAALALKYLHYKSSSKFNIRGLKYAYTLSLIGGLSWLVLMPGHAYPHAHLNAIIFYMPFLLICYVILGLFTESVFRRYFSHD